MFLIITLTTQASDLITDLWSYTELSPSRTGLHIIVEGSVPEGRRRNGIEVYATGRYFTVTTNHLKGSPDTIETRQTQLDTLYASLTPIQPAKRPMQPEEHHLFISDEKVLEKAQNAANGHRFMQLYNGDMTGFSSKSEADWELVLRLCYWTNDDVEQVKRLSSISTRR